MLVILFGITGNSFVIATLVRQKTLLKNNNYFLILQLAISDLAVLTIYFLDDIFKLKLQALLYDQSTTYRLFFNIYLLFQTAGIGIMLVISAFRYRAVVQLMPALSRRKVKIVCCLVYTVSFIVGYGPTVPSSFIDAKEKRLSYDKYHTMYLISCYYIFPVIFMAVIYYKMYRKLLQQDNYMKSKYSNPVTNGTTASFNVLTSKRNRRISLVFLCVVLCYAVGNIPVTVYFIWTMTGKHHSFTKYAYVEYFANVFRLAGSHAINPLIYGILDKRLVASFKICRRKKRKAQLRTNQFSMELLRK